LELLLAQGVIRRWRLEDIPSLVRHANDRRVWRNLKDRFPHPAIVKRAPADLVGRPSEDVA